MQTNFQNSKIAKILEELDVKYNASNAEDIEELTQILTNKLHYPSTERALLHMKANRLGTLDLYKSKDKKQNNDGKQEGEVDQKESIKQLKYCHCCGLVQQPHSLPICTPIKNINHLGISIRLFFIGYEHLILMMIALFFGYGLYAIISNVNSCEYDAQNLQPRYRNSPFYIYLISSWIFEVSLHANLACQTSTKSYQIQCWLAVALIVLTGVVMAVLKYRKFRAGFVLAMRSKTVQTLSIYIQNLPYDMQKEQLQRQLRAYRKRVCNPDMPESMVQINVVKVNKYSPFYISATIFNHKQIKDVNQRYQKLKQRLADLIKQRRKYDSFVTSFKERNRIYEQFQNIKKERVRVFQKVISEKLEEQKEKQKNKVITVPAFITFENVFNKLFLMNMNSNAYHFLNDEKYFYFQAEKIKAKINQAPKPQQVLWVNLGQPKRDLIIKKIIIAFITLLFLVGTCAGLYFFQKANFDMVVYNKASTLGITFLAMFILIIISYLIAIIIYVLNKKQRNITYMHEQRSLNNKLTISLIANFLLIPIIFNLFFKIPLIGVISLSQSVFILSIQTAYLFPLLKYFDIFQLANILIRRSAEKPLNKLLLSQKQMNSKFQLRQFQVGMNFGYAVRITLFTFFYAPLEPIIIVFTLFGLIIMYWLEKYSLFYRCSRPVPGNRMVNISMNKYIALGPVLFGIGCLIWPYVINKEIIALTPCIIAIVFATIIGFLPLEKIVDLLVERAKKKYYFENFMKNYMPQDKKDGQQHHTIDPQSYSANKFKYKYEYDRLNFFTAKQAIRKHIKQTHHYLSRPQRQLYSSKIFENSTQRTVNNLTNISNMNYDKIILQDQIIAQVPTNVRNIMDRDVQTKDAKIIEEMVEQESVLSSLIENDKYYNDDNQMLIEEILNYLRKNVSRVKNISEMHSTESAKPRNLTHETKHQNYFDSRAQLMKDPLESGKNFATHKELPVANSQSTSIIESIQHLKEEENKQNQQCCQFINNKIHNHNNEEHCQLI